MNELELMLKDFSTENKAKINDMLNNLIIAQGHFINLLYELKEKINSQNPEETAKGGV